MARGHAGLLGLILSLAVVGCGSGQPEESRPATSTGSVTTSDTSTTTVPPPASSAAPRWETVSTLSGTGPQTYELAILQSAIQWRIRWNCDAGALRVESSPPPRRGGPLVDAGCPGQGEAFSIQTGSIRLDVRASSPWKAIVDQQVDRPLDEAVPPEASSATLTAEGAFYGVEKQGKGRALLYGLPDGRRILRFEDFEVSQNTDLFVWLSEAAQPRTTVEAVNVPKVELGNLKSTLGNQNYEVPADLPSDRIRSVVIWCEPVAVAYSAASLSR